MQAKMRRAFADRDYETAFSYQTRLCREAVEGKRLRDCDTELSALVNRDKAWPLSFVYDHGARNGVELALISRRLLRASDEAESLPRFLAWQPLPAAADAAGAVSFDGTFPSLVALACGAGRGFALGCGQDECGTVAAVWTPKRSVCSDGLRSDEVDAQGAARDSRPLSFTADQLHARLAHMERRCAAARTGKPRADEGSDSDSDNCGYDDGEESGGDDDEENDEFMRELSQSLTPQPSPAKVLPSDADVNARFEREMRRREAEDEAAAKAAEARAARRAAEAARLAPASQSQPPVQPLRFAAAFPAITALLCADGGAKRYWLFYANRQLRLFRGLWRGERGVLNLGMRKAPAWVAPSRHARVHDALAELETHLRQRTGRGRAVAAAERRAAKAAERAARDAAKRRAERLKAVEKATKLVAKQQRALKKLEAAAAREAKRFRHYSSGDGA